MSIFEKNLTVQYMVDLENKTSHDIGGACSNEKRKWCNQIPSDNTLGRNYPTAGYKLSY